MAVILKRSRKMPDRTMGMVCNNCGDELGILVLPTGPITANFQDLKYICTPCINDMAVDLNLNSIDSSKNGIRSSLLLTSGNRLSIPLLRDHPDNDRLRGTAV